MLFQKNQIIKRDVSQLPILLANGIPYGMVNKQLAEFQPITGLTNIHQAFSQLKQTQRLEEANYNEVENYYIQEQNPIVPVDKPVADIIVQENQNVQVTVL